MYFIFIYFKGSNLVQVGWEADIPHLCWSNVCENVSNYISKLLYTKGKAPEFIRKETYSYWTNTSFPFLQELMNLLIERFSIPDPSLVYEDQEKSQIADGDSDVTNISNIQREDWKRYRKEYCQPVQFRYLPPS